MQRFSVSQKRQPTVGATVPGRPQIANLCGYLYKIGVPRATEGGRPYMKLSLLFLLILLTFALTGCRVRLIDVITEPETVYEPQPQEIVETPPPLIDEEYEPEPPEEEPSDPGAPEPPEPEPPEPEEPSAPPEETVEPIIEALAHETTEVPRDDTPYNGIAAGYYDAPVLVDELEETDIPYVTIEDLSPEAAGDTTLDTDSDGTLGLILDHHTGVLSRGLGSLFECQRLCVYFEHLADFHTVNHSSLQHALIVDSGGFNAAARRGSDALIVDADWVQRRNPAVIIRTVGSDILGRSITDTNRAQALRNEIFDRPGFENVNAVLDRRVLLLSEELLHSYEGRLIAKLHIAHAMYPTLFADVNLAELYWEIAAAGGGDYTMGIFAF